MKDISKQMKDEVDQCSVEKKCFEIEKKQLLINNDRLLEENISCDITSTYLRLLNEVDNCGKCKSLDIVLLDLQESKKSLCELKKHFANLEEYIISLDISFQNHKEKMINDSRINNNNNLVQTINNQTFEINDLKVQLQDKTLVINELKHQFAQMHNLDSRIQKIEDENVSLAFQTRAKTKLQTESLQQKLNDQISENNKLRAQLKAKFSESQLNQNGTNVNTKLFEPPTSGTKLYSLTPLPKSKLIPKVVEKNDLSKPVTSHLTTNKIIEKCTKILASGLLKIESKPINAYFKNNRVVHRDYLKVTNEHVGTLQELLEQARPLKPLDDLVFVSDLCPFTQSGNEKWAHATRRVSFTDASGSKVRRNTKNDRIQRPSCRSKKNKVEA
ncbi:hypothetical protein Tco_1046725 [Tanacetum coccineum]